MRVLVSLLVLLVAAASVGAQDSSHLDQAKALALRWEETELDRRESLVAVFRKADAIRSADRSHAPMPWSVALELGARGTEFRQDDVYWLARRALESKALHSNYAVAMLAWTPGDDARTVLLALADPKWSGGRYIDGLHFALSERVRSSPAERAALVEIATKLPPTGLGRCALLRAMLGVPRDRPPPDRVVLEQPVVDAITATLKGLADADGDFPPGALGLCQSLAYAATSEWGPPLARLVERDPRLLESLDHTLRAVQAPVDRAFLWSQLGSGHGDKYALALLARELGPADRGYLLDALAPGRWTETGFYLRVELLRRAPMDLLDESVHTALWSIAETGPRTAALNVAPAMAVEVIERFEDPSDDSRLDRLIASGPNDPGSEALRVLLRRSDDPLVLFLSQLDHEDPACRYVAASTLVVDFQSSPKLPVPRSIDAWRKFGAVLERRVLDDTEPNLQRRELSALYAVTVPGPLSPMRDRTLKDDRALAAFCARLLAKRPDTPARLRAVDLLRWSRVTDALELLTTLAKDPDPKLAKSAASAAEQVRSQIPE